MSDLRDAISTMAAIELELRSAVTEGHNLVDQEETVTIMRQRYANAVKVVGALIDNDDQLKDDPALNVEFRRRFAAMRSAVNEFQTRWPASALGEPDAEFSEAAIELVRHNGAFIEWVDEMLV